MYSYNLFVLTCFVRGRHIIDVEKSLKNTDIILNYVFIFELVAVIVNLKNISLTQYCLP